MNCRFVRIIVSCLLFTGIPVCLAAPAKAPNFLFLLADDLGWADLKCYGSSFHETPNLDRLAQDGMRFSTFYSAGAVCSPTRSSILTGKYPPRTGITDWIPGQDVTGRKLVQLHPRRQLALEEVTFAEALRPAGYQTVYIGKWHLGGKGYQPQDQGFDIYEGYEEEGSAAETDRSARLKRRLESTEKFTDSAKKFLEARDPAKPFMLFLSYHDVHTPIQPMPGIVEDYEQKARKLSGETPVKAEHEGRTRMRQDNPAYASMVAALDRSVGQVRHKLEELRLAKDTIVIFTSDNGGLSTTRNIGPTCNSPLRAGKGWLYEGGIRVPLLVLAPGMTKAGSVTDASLISCDFYPTLLELAGVPLRPQQHLDGVSFAQLLSGGAAPAPRPLFWHYPHYHGSTWTPGAAVRDENWKLIESFERGSIEMFDLSQDPGEANNVADEQTAKRRELLQKLHNWQKSVGAIMPVPDTAVGDQDQASRKKRKR